MDPISVGVGFLLAILGGGFVAVLAQHIASRDARALAQESFAEASRLHEEERKARERALLVAVVHELAGNSTMLKAGSGGTGMAMLHRSAWDGARTLVLPTEVAAALAMAYLHVDRYNAAVEGLRLVIPMRNAQLIEALTKNTDAEGLARLFMVAIDQIHSKMGIRVYEEHPPK
jgi:hypothetical protein